MTVIRFEFDLISPYAYLAWHAVRPLAERHGATVEPVPVLFAAMLNHHGQLGPAEIPAKRIYTFTDCARSAHRMGLPLSPPAAHPFNPLLALRVAALPMAAPTRAALVTDLFAAVWGGGTGVTEPSVVAGIAMRHGLKDALEQATSPEGKEQIHANTRAAIARGAFGVPSMWVDGELFWGLDSLPNLAHYLQGERPPQASIEAWQTLPAGAHRSRKS